MPEQKHDHNFLSKMSDVSLIVILFVFIPGIFAIGYYFGSKQADRETLETKIEIKSLRDSIQASRTAILNQHSLEKIKVSKK